MKKFGISLFLIFPVLGFSQKIFEGKITYASHLMNDSMLMVNYYSPGKIRTEMFLSDNDFLKDDTYIVGLLDSNVYYMIQTSEKKVTMIINDALPFMETTDRVPVKDELVVLGIKCYGIKDLVKYDLPMIDSNFSVSMQVISHYAKDLYFPYTITPFFTQASMVYNNHICLSAKTIYNYSKPGETEMVLTAIKVEHTKNADTLFQIPKDFTIETTKMSELILESKTKVTVRELTFEELKQEESPPPPPPPPPKDPKSSKTPAKKGKQKPTKG